MVIDLPDYRQPTDASCGQTAAKVVYGYFGRRGVRPQGTPIDGTDPRTLESALRLAGLVVQSGSMDADDLKHHTRKGRPVVCLVTEADGTGHWVVVAGVRRGRVHFHCPLVGPRVEPVAAFAARWHDSDRVAVRYEQWGIACWSP